MHSQESTECSKLEVIKITPNLWLDDFRLRNGTRKEQMAHFQAVTKKSANNMPAEAMKLAHCLVRL